MFWETVGIYCENHTGHTNTMGGRMQVFIQQVVHIQMNQKSLCAYRRRWVHSESTWTL